MPKYAIEDLSYEELYELWVLLRFAYKNPMRSQTDDMPTIDKTYEKVGKILADANKGREVR